jgi:hypothetical protein
MDIYSLCSELDECSEVTYDYDSNESFIQLLSIIKQDLMKCKYRKVFQSASNVREGIFSQLKNYWKLTEYRLEAILKIISKRIFRYIPGPKNLYPLKALDTWFRESADALELWSDSIETYEGNEEQVNSFIYYTLWEIYLHSLHLKNQNRYFEAAAMLSIGERLIKESVNSCKNPRTLNICQKIYIFLSSLLIADGSYEMAKQYQYYSMQLLIKEIFYRTNLDDRFLTETDDYYEQYSIRNVFTNFSIIFYQRGACEEHLDSLDKALECYRQSNWAAKKFLKPRVPEFVQFLHYLEDKVFKYLELSKILIKENYQRERDREKGKKAMKQIGKESLDEKFEKIKLEVDKVISMIPENNMEHTYEEETPKRYILSTLDLVEKLLSPEFRQIVRETGDIKLFEMDKEFKEKFKKKIGQLRIAKLFKEKARELFSRKHPPSLMEIYSLVKLNNERKEKECSLRNTEETCNKRKSFLKAANERIKARATSALTGETAYTTTGNRVLSTIGSQPEVAPKDTLRTKKSESVRFFLVGTEKKNNIVQKISHDNYVFSNKFKRKIDYLTSLEKRELTFQKKLLGLKKYEKIPHDHKDELQIHREVQAFFENTIKTKITSNVGPQEVGDVPITSHRRVKRHRKLENTVIQSLDPKKLEEFAKFLRKRDSQILLNREFLPNANNSEKLPTKEIEKLKTQIMNDIGKKLNTIEEKQKVYQKVLTPAKFKTPAYTARRSITEYEKPLHHMDDFIKFSSHSQHRMSILNTASFKK